jgi:hypothetical protein
MTRRPLGSWKEAKVVALPKPGKDPKFPQNLRPISLLPSTGKVFEKVLLEIATRHIGESNLLNASQFGFRARHSTTLQCMRLADHVTLNFNNTLRYSWISKKTLTQKWHPGLFYKFSKLQFSNRLIKLISSFLSQRKFRVSVEGEISTPRYMQAGVPQGSVLSFTLYNLYINNTPPNHRCKLSSLCRRHLSICYRLQRGLCSEKDPAWPKLYGGLL